MPQIIDLSSSKRIHIIAIGGSGMSAIAGVLMSMGHEITGSDASQSVYFERLSDAGANVWLSHDASKLPDDLDAVAISTAVKEDNPELQEAKRRGIPVLRRADVLASIAGTRRTIAVAGTHGKTTTSTFLALALESGGVRPSWVIGGELIGRGNGAHWDSGAWFVVEADESDGTFLDLGAEAAIVTNVEPDHLETYGGYAQLQSAFDTFIESSRTRVVCIDDEGGRLLASKHEVITYGQDESARYRIVDVELGRFEAKFTIKYSESDKQLEAKVQLPIAGMHNVQNAAAAMVMAHQVGVPLEISAAGLATFGGVGRRFQCRGEKNGVTFIDDYAHLPGEVEAALAAAHAGKWNRIVAVFQPHRFSRTEQVGADFITCFNQADLLVLTDVYSAGEQPRPGVDGQVVVRAVESASQHPPITYVQDRADLAVKVAGLLQPGDLCITLGAGDITKLATEIIELKET